MKHNLSVLMLALLLATSFWPSAAGAQDSHATAVRPVQLSVFGGVSGVFTGLSGGKNFSIAAGGDLALPPYRWVRPVIEVRGTYPIDHGTVDSQKSVLGGLRVDFLLGHKLHPYGDFLFGRGQIDYGSGYFFNNQIFELTTTYIDSSGAGFDYDFTDHLAIKVDGQYQRWAGGPSVPTPSGDIYSTVGTIGIAYRFGFDRGHRR